MLSHYLILQGFGNVKTFSIKARTDAGLALGLGMSLAKVPHVPNTPPG